MIIIIFVCIQLIHFYKKKQQIIFYSLSIDRKRRRVDNDDGIILIKLVRFCPSCHLVLSSKSKEKKEEIISNPIGFIDSIQANDLLSCYL